jgi:hypothetical protein
MNDYRNIYFKAETNVGVWQSECRFGMRDNGLVYKPNISRILCVPTEKLSIFGNERTFHNMMNKVPVIKADKTSIKLLKISGFDKSRKLKDYLSEYVNHLTELY